MHTINHTQRTRNERGFTMIEVMVAVLIFSILAAIAIPIYNSQKQVVASQQLQVALTNLALVIERDAKLSTGEYPATMPAGVGIPEHIAVTYGSTGDSWCAEAFDSDTEEKTTFYVGGDGVTNTNITEGECEGYSGSLRLDSPNLEADIDTENRALLRWNAVDGAMGYAVQNVTTGVTHYLPDYSDSTTWTSEPLTVPTEFRISASADGHISSNSNRIRVNPRPVEITAPVITVEAQAAFFGSANIVMTWTEVTGAEVTQYQVQDSVAGTPFAYVNANSDDRRADMWFSRSVSLTVVAYNGNEEVARSTPIAVDVPEEDW